MDAESTKKEVEEAMTKAVDYMIHEFASVRTGKASPALVENMDVPVASYGSNMKLKALAVITTPEARTIMIQPFGGKSRRRRRRRRRKKTDGSRKGKEKLF